MGYSAAATVSTAPRNSCAKAMARAASARSARIMAAAEERLGGLGWAARRGNFE